MNEEIQKIIAIDFDGTIVTDEFPEIGNPRPEMIKLCKLLKEHGAKLILWTCRTGEYLEKAVEFCRNQGIEFDAVNENLPEVIKKYEGDARKIFANIYIEDKAITPWDDLFKPLLMAGFGYDAVTAITSDYWRL